LEYIQQSDYWGLSWDPSLIINLSASSEIFEQLAGLVDIMGTNDAMVQAIGINLPKDYCIIKLPKLVVNQISKLLPYDKFNNWMQYKQHQSNIRVYVPY
jgi:hypothetical protein